MSFALECKEEIMNNKRNPEACRFIALGMLFTGSRQTDTEIVFYSANSAIRDFFGITFRKGFLVTGEKKEARMTNEMLSVYEYVISKEQFDLKSDVVNELKASLEKKEQNISLFLSGCFLSRGSVNDPKTSKYHLEFALKDAQEAVYIQHLINLFDFNSKIAKRRNRFVVYIKDAEKVVDLLRIVGAKDKAFAFEDLRIERDFSNSINRVINCEVHNAEKSIAAANEQMKYLRYLKYNYPLEKLENKLLLVMKVRFDNPDANLNELCQIILDEYGEKISKPGLSHRFAKLKEIAIQHEKNTK